ncbi:MAG: glycosyl hydrolase family 18 protein [Clostridia bacterium]|nr:glycosyl hydrolase family 18 protein [Clostridia bacterium]
MFQKNRKASLKAVLLTLLVCFVITNIFNPFGSVTNEVSAATTPDYSDHPKRIVGYFQEWGDQEMFKNYTVHDIPWGSITHINYAFAKVNDNYLIDFCDKTAAIEKVYPGQDETLPYKGHFNLLTVYKKKYPDVKTLISIGGWAESFGFFQMAATAAGREKFANSCIDFMRTYNFDGLDIDWEYPSATETSGNPRDWCVSDKMRTTVYGNYLELMKLLRQKVDAAASQDGKQYLLTAAVSASSWVLGGMGLGEYCQYLDFVNLMTYDLHGSWNRYVAHLAALWPDSRDPETVGFPMPVLNVDWAFRYFRGALPPEKINIGIPYYSRGWKDVSKGSLPGGLYGSSPDQYTVTYPNRVGGGTVSETTAYGPDGIDGIWNDPAPDAPAGCNPIWHIKTLEKTPGYQRFFDDVSKVPYLWNEQKKIFLTYDDEESLKHKIQYIIDKNAGGMMMWELSGDFKQNPDGTFDRGSYMTDMAYNMFKNAKYPTPTPQVIPPLADYKVTFTAKYDHPNLNYSMKIANNTGETWNPGTTIEFDIPKSCVLITNWSNVTLQKITDTGDFNHVSLKTNEWGGAIKSGGSITIDGEAQLCMTGGPQRVLINGKGSKAEWASIPTPSPTPTVPPTYKISGYLAPDVSAQADVKSGFTVSASGSSVQAVSNTNGYFELSVPVGTTINKLTITKPGYLKREISSTFNTSVQLGSSAAPLAMWAGDVLVDDAINMSDIVSLVGHFNTAKGQPEFDTACDFDKDDAINMSDIVILINHFNTTSAAYPAVTFNTPPPTPTPTNTPVPTNTPSPSPTPTPEGGYYEWSPDNVQYNVGDMVRYQGSTYKCLMTHSSNIAWTPSAVPTLWQKVN